MTRTGNLILVVGVLAVGPLALPTGAAPRDTSDDARYVDVRFERNTGYTVEGRCELKRLELVTKYGELHIPVADLGYVRRLQPHDRHYVEAAEFPARGEIELNGAFNVFGQHKRKVEVKTWEFTEARFNYHDEFRTDFPTALVPENQKRFNDRAWLKLKNGKAWDGKVKGPKDFLFQTKYGRLSVPMEDLLAIKDYEGSGDRLLVCTEAFCFVGTPLAKRGFEFKGKGGGGRFPFDQLESLTYYEVH